MSVFNYSYEYLFKNNFDDNIFNEGQILDVDLKFLIQNAVDSINGILSIYTGVKNFSTFVLYNNQHFKVTLLVV